MGTVDVVLMLGMLDHMKHPMLDLEEVGIVETETGFRMRVEPKVVEPGHHRRPLLRLTGPAASAQAGRRSSPGSVARLLHATTGRMTMAAPRAIGLSARRGGRLRRDQAKLT